MSSGPQFVDCSPVFAQRTEYDIRQMPLERAKRFTHGLAFLKLLRNKRASRWETTTLHEGDDMQDAIELTIAPSIESMPSTIATRGLDRGHARVRREPRCGRKAIDVSHNAHDLRRAQPRETVDAKQSGGYGGG